MPLTGGVEPFKLSPMGCPLQTKVLLEIVAPPIGVEITDTVNVEGGDKQPPAVEPATV